MIQNIKFNNKQVYFELVFHNKYNRGLEINNQLKQMLKRTLNQNIKIELSESHRDKIVYFVHIDASDDTEKNKEKYNSVYFEKNLLPQFEVFKEKALNYLEEQNFKTILNSYSRIYGVVPSKKNDEITKVELEIREKEKELKEKKKDLEQLNVKAKIEELENNHSLKEEHKEQLLEKLKSHLD